MAKIYDRSSFRNRRLQSTVRKIVEDVRLNGDEAVLKYTKKFDGVSLKARQMKISESETSGAFQDIDPKFISALKAVIENITKFYSKRARKSWRMRSDDGAVLGQICRPIEKVGVYVPSGTVPLVSSVYMTVLPARIAGVKEIYLVTPPNKYKSINPHILAVANLLKVNGIYKAGGAQGIAALAFGTKTIPKVDKIVGPGNQYVTEAKRQVFGYVDIDMVAGPTELVIIANRYANPEYIKSDLEAQGEHYRGYPILITESKKMAKAFKNDPMDGYVILVRNMDEAAEVSNRIAPEHLQIMVKRPQRLLKKITNAGAIFVGNYTPTAVGDYVAGPSHVLPTGGTARFFSGLGIDDFIKSSHMLSYSKRSLEKVKDYIEIISKLEGLSKHMESVDVRFK
ncbi:MAG: histidinol dehydrogenase [Candidatus Omnitrophica bacterium CG1_02_49_10]|nr:MAG: histidinol dehydrogenase [Candidatus Omnitrophica bacterium CG1_02_49_10]